MEQPKEQQPLKQQPKEPTAEEILKQNNLDKFAQNYEAFMKKNDIYAPVGHFCKTMNGLKQTLKQDDDSDLEKDKQPPTEIISGKDQSDVLNENETKSAVPKDKDDVFEGNPMEIANNNVEIQRKSDEESFEEIESDIKENHVVISSQNEHQTNPIVISNGKVARSNNRRNKRSKKGDRLYYKLLHKISALKHSFELQQRSVKQMELEQTSVKQEMELKQRSLKQMELEQRSLKQEMESQKRILDQGFSSLEKDFRSVDKNFQTTSLYIYAIIARKSINQSLIKLVKSNSNVRMEGKYLKLEENTKITLGNVTMDNDAFRAVMQEIYDMKDIANQILHMDYKESCFKQFVFQDKIMFSEVFPLLDISKYFIQDETELTTNETKDLQKTLNDLIQQHRDAKKTFVFNPIRSKNFLSS